MKITQEQFNSFPVVNGIKKCPTGDYSDIKSFAERCSFAKLCCAQSPFWTFVYKPKNLKTKGKILISYPAYLFWKERFDLDITGEFPVNQDDKIKDILAKEKITECEKWILESWI